MLKLIIIEDEIFTAKQIKSSISWEDYNIEVTGIFTNSSKALEYISGNKVDIVITDIKMPVMDGLTLIEKCKETEKEIQFIILTGYREFEYARRAIQFGVTEYLLKPIQYSTLTDAIKKASKAASAIQNSNSFDIIDFAPFQNNKKAILRRNVFSNILYGMITDVSELEQQIAKTDIPEYVISNPCILINLTFLNFDIFIEEQWKHFIDGFKNALIQNIPFETDDLYFIVVNFSFDQLLIFAISKKKSDSFRECVEKHLELISANLLSIMSLSSTYEIVSVFNSLSDIVSEIPQTINNDSDDIIDMCKKYINDNLNRQITLLDISNHVHLNPVYISAYLKKKTGINFSTYIMNARIEYAKKLLKNTSISISKICESTGYKSESYFYKTFKSTTGITPMQYREKYLKKESL